MRSEGKGDSRHAETSTYRHEVTMTKNRLVGTWKLVSFETHGDDGSVHYAYGRDPVGYIIYGQDGYMHVAFMKANRPRISANILALATTEEKAWAAVYFESYCGRYEVRGDRVFYHVEVSLNPNSTGEVLERDMQLKHDSLVLTVPPINLLGISYTHRLVWRRI